MPLAIRLYSISAVTARNGSVNTPSSQNACMAFAKMYVYKRNVHAYMSACVCFFYLWVLTQKYDQNIEDSLGGFPDICLLYTTTSCCWWPKSSYFYHEVTKHTHNIPLIFWSTRSTSSWICVKYPGDLKNFHEFHKFSEHIIDSTEWPRKPSHLQSMHKGYMICA